MTNRNYEPTPKFYNIGYEPIIGTNCSLVNTLFDCAAQIIIGNNVAFGHNVMLLTAKHVKEFYGTERMEMSVVKPITIHDGVWIASGAIILQGVTIGENAVVGAGSVVVRDVPSYWFVAGNPAELKHCLRCNEFICLCE